MFAIFRIDHEGVITHSVTENIKERDNEIRGLVLKCLNEGMKIIADFDTGFKEPFYLINDCGYKFILKTGLLIPEQTLEAN